MDLWTLLRGRSTEQQLTILGRMHQHPGGYWYCGPLTPEDIAMLTAGLR